MNARPHEPSQGAPVPLEMAVRWATHAAEIDIELESPDLDATVRERLEREREMYRHAARYFPIAA